MEQSNTPQDYFDIEDSLDALALTLQDECRKYVKELEDAAVPWIPFIVEQKDSEWPPAEDWLRIGQVILSQNLLSIISNHLPKNPAGGKAFCLNHDELVSHGIWSLFRISTFGNAESIMQRLEKIRSRLDDHATFPKALPRHGAELFGVVVEEFTIPYVNRLIACSTDARLHFKDIRHWAATTNMLGRTERSVLLEWLYCWRMAGSSRPDNWLRDWFCPIFRMNQDEKWNTIRSKESWIEECKKHGSKYWILQEYTQRIFGGKTVEDYSDNSLLNVTLTNSCGSGSLTPDLPTNSSLPVIASAATIEDSHRENTPQADGPFATDGLCFSGVKVRFGKASLRYKLVMALWDARSKTPAPARQIEEVMSEIYGEEHEKTDAAFRQLCSDTRTHFQKVNCPLTIVTLNGKVHLATL